MKEAELQKLVLDYLKKKKGYFVWRSYVGPIVRGRAKILSPNPMAGFPDIFGFTDTNKPFAIELKSQTGKLSDKQVNWLQNLKAKGVHCIVARDLETVIIELAKIPL
jgi:hypothetical protein